MEHWRKHSLVLFVLRHRKESERMKKSILKQQKGKSLIIIENGQIISYELDKKDAWEIGRPTPNENPDIQLSTKTVSRKHGRFQKLDGFWFYLDYNGKNGTVYNRKHLSSGLGGRIKPVLLDDGDTFVFGGGKEETINSKTVFGVFLTKTFEEKWHVVDTKGYEQLLFTSGAESSIKEKPKKGLVLEGENGIAIYMGDLTYVNVAMEVVGL